MMDDVELLQQVQATQREIVAVENARGPVSEEIAAENNRLIALAERARQTPGQWPGINATFNVTVFNDTLLANMFLVAPKATEALVVERIKAAAALWTGLRMTAAERVKRLATLQRNLDQLEAQAELARRQEEAGNPALTLPRALPWRPGIWLRTTPDLQRLAKAA
jgi:hypothetical protein